MLGAVMIGVLDRVEVVVTCDGVGYDIVAGGTVGQGHVQFGQTTCITVVVF